MKEALHESYEMVEMGSGREADSPTKAELCLLLPFQVYNDDSVVASISKNNNNSLR